MATLNASSHSAAPRGDRDYYASPPHSVLDLFAVEEFSDAIWEPACGEGHLSKTMEVAGKRVLSTDLVARGYGGVADFLDGGLLSGEIAWEGDIITNPPFSRSTEFAERALEILHPGRKLALLLRIQFLESVKRQRLFQSDPPKMVYVYVRNIRCAKNGDFANATGNASTYAWFVWEKGYRGTPGIGWIQP
jgi:hypothetical protein